ncbi:MAG: heat-inducible transcriptional repressor HrcA [Candidatus Marinimicrobia bacterium]|nr:heat-inducible transcriptional repressor HrcA [Candidatus Neomarinimicrobiota bacterium]
MQQLRQEALSELKNREEKVLKWLIRDYIHSGHPVGSSRLVSMDYFNVGSATIRNVLSSLESAGYLIQPHTSSGRIPTDKGYRYFVDRLMQSSLPENEIIRDYESSISEIHRDLDQLIKNTAQFLGDVSHALVLMSKPHERTRRIKSIALHELDKESILLIVHTSFDQVRTIALELRSKLSRLMLMDAQSMLNDIFADRDYDDILVLVDSGSVDHARKNPIINAILNNLYKVIQANTFGEYQIYGTHQLLHYPEMTDPLSLETLLEAIETDNLQRYLPTLVTAGQPSVYIGSELGQSILSKMSIVSIAYNGNNCNGEIHILGPTRMAYEKIIGLAKFTANKMETMINTKYVK